MLAIFRKCNILAYMSYTNIGHTTGYILSIWSALLLYDEPSYGNFRIWLTFWPHDLIIWHLTSKTLNTSQKRWKYPITVLNYTFQKAYDV